ncbi:MAG TPA: LuxR C-terminal-related transcriptional regulator [Gaiellaceae bacterium]
MSTLTDARLSPRQRDVLVLMSDGVRVKEIAVRLGLSETTVRNHVRLLLRRLECHSQLEAVARAREWQLL